MEIERKYLLKKIPDNLSDYPCKKLIQAYLCTSPVVRVRREGDDFVLTCKSKGFLAREEYNLPLTEGAFYHLLAKADGNIISKTRYYIPLDDSHTAELDVFDKPFAPLTLVEVEFASLEDANTFVPPGWFEKEVTEDPAYHNSYLSQKNL